MRRPKGRWGKKGGRGPLAWVGGSVLLLVGLAGAVAIVWAVRAAREGASA